MPYVRCVFELKLVNCRPNVGSMVLVMHELFLPISASDSSYLESDSLGASAFPDKYLQSFKHLS